MNARRCLKIAARIGTLLEQEIGIGVDARRMLTERLYLRDVLLVCEAHRGNELAELARWFRRSAAETPADGAPPSGFGADSAFPISGFGSSAPDTRNDVAASLPSAALLVRQQLEQQRAAARQGGLLLAARSAGR
jgi:hypothetical protein